MEKWVTIVMLLLWACDSAKQSTHDISEDKGFENPGNGTAARHSEDLLHEAEAADRIFLETTTDGAEIQDSDAPLPSDGICNSCSPYIKSTEEDLCRLYFYGGGGCSGTVSDFSGFWDKSRQCCWCRTCDCGKSCTRASDCVGPCVLCLHFLGMFCDTEPPWVGFCWSDPGKCPRGDGCIGGCVTYLDDHGNPTEICADPECF